MDCTITKDGNDLVFSLVGQMDLNDLSMLRNILQSVELNGAFHAVFDMEDLQQLNCVGIGILLLADDVAHKHGDHVELRHLHGQVDKIAHQAHLSRVFEID